VNAESADRARAEGPQTRRPSGCPCIFRPELVSSLGGHLVSLDCAFGDDDVYVICELPDDEAAAAAGVRITATGAVTAHTIKLLSPEQIDSAIDRELEYRKPGA
jgi:hypothetical protein